MIARPWLSVSRIASPSGLSLWVITLSDLIAARLTAVQERYPGLEQVNVGSVIGTPEAVVLEQLRWFGEEVMPRFRAEREDYPG